MNEFNRGIKNQAFISALNELYSDVNSFWHKMVTDKELFIAIRKEYISVYFKGQSVCKLEYKNGVIGHTHKKYLGINEAGYCTSRNGIIQDKKAMITSLSEIDQLKNNVERYLGKEKVQSYSEVLNYEKTILDVEITLVKEKITSPRKKSEYEVSSIDYLALEHNIKGEMTLVFYEAKHFTNSEIRSRTTPKVVEQINRYEEAIQFHLKEIRNSYRLVSQNLYDLHILAHRGFGNNMLIAENISIDPAPRLIIFGIDKNIDDDPHILKLRGHLGSRLILMRKI